MSEAAGDGFVQHLIQADKADQRVKENQMRNDLTALRTEIMTAEQEANQVLDYAWFQAHPDHDLNLTALRDAVSDVQATLDNLLVEVTATMEKHPNV